SVIFSAQTFVLKYDPRNMIEGKLEASQIIAQKPRVLLTQNLDTGTWNYHRLGRRRQQRPQPQPAAPARPPPLPEVLLRNARVEISEVCGKERRDVGFVAIDGQLAPSADGEHYNFELQSRGVQGVRPLASGSAALATG